MSDTPLTGDMNFSDFYLTEAHEVVLLVSPTSTREKDEQSNVLPKVTQLTSGKTSIQTLPL